MKINIFTDGAYSPKTKKGGWAVYCPELRLRMCGAVKDTTNNRMELLSAIKALEFIDDTHLHLEELVIYEHKDKIWARSLKMFISKVDKQKYPNCKQEYRFELIND